LYHFNQSFCRKIGHSYNDPIVTSDDLRNWFMEMITIFPALNGPFAVDDPNENVSDYCIGKDVIYVAFGWSIAEKAYGVMESVAEKHRVGFYDASADDGDILFPNNNGKNYPIDRPQNLSSIEQIKNWAAPGQEGKSVKEILYAKLNLPTNSEHIISDKTINTERKRNWWQRFFGLK
jgi:hypothetical protein